MNYPNGKKAQPLSNQTNQTFSNRGMTLEDDINQTNQYYLDVDKAVIHKKPTPIQIVKVNYPKRSAAVITEAYFKQASTTDYNGLYRNYYLDFEAKETKNKTSFPLANVHEHQIKHMESIVKHGGIAFIIIRFTVHNETYLLEAEKLFPYWYEKQASGRKSIPYKEIKQTGYLIPFKYQTRVDYLSIIDQLYFNNH
ncbi:Holliday junction resolvase RecU [Ornithinibacillus halotolerans]|uniref:Holliday junction resolvase RecU n=1 Tax=Ornithinibacillus halotolerans TaxID=1274357 RepID=A0A916RP49_9BACI|nr:Holliday junction resolvase RecU [Ornithinibacillus halotolerans]GGA61552.1 Holliday junction resolvase RecU [Ornithinibacillus halotolerans]